MGREEYINAIASIFAEMLKKAIISYVIKKLPFMALPFLNPILGLIVSKIVDEGIKEARIRTYFIYVDFRTNQQAKTFSDLAIVYNQNRTPENEKKMLDAFYLLCSFNRV